MPILIPILQGLRLFESLPCFQAGRIVAGHERARVERREVVIKRGDANAGLGFLIEGRLQAVDFTLDGKEVGIDFVEERDFFGELAVIDGQAAPEYVIAVAPSRVVLLDRERARQLMFSTPKTSERSRLDWPSACAVRRGSVRYWPLPSSFQTGLRATGLLTQRDRRRPGGDHSAPDPSGDRDHGQHQPRDRHPNPSVPAGPEGGSTRRRNWW
jgi:hypothetical protein